MTRHLDIKDIALVGRIYDEYRLIFQLHDADLAQGKILDIAAGTSSFCAEASRRGYGVTAADRIYGSPIETIEAAFIATMEDIMRQMPGLAHQYRWDYFQDPQCLQEVRTRAFRLFKEDYCRQGASRYVPAVLPATGFKDKEFILTLVSHFLFLYDDRLDYAFHRQTILELLRITSGEIRIFPVVNLAGERSAWVEALLRDPELSALSMEIKQVDYEFLKKAKEMMSLRIGGYGG